MLQASAKATPESINKDSENKTAGFAAALRTVFGIIRDFFDRLGNLKEKKAFAQLTLVVTLHWLTEVYPACATFLVKGEQALNARFL
jgi:hypothetical protein